MVLIGRRGFLQVGVGSLGLLAVKPLSGYADLGRIEEQALFDEVVKNPLESQAGQALIDKVVQRMFGARAHDNVDNYFYDCSYSQLEEDLKVIYRMAAEDPDYIKYITKKLKSEDFFNDMVDDYARIVEDQSLSEDERVRNASAILRANGGPRHFLLSFADYDASSEVNYHYKDTIACTIKKKLTPGFPTRSSCYFNKFNFEDLDLSQDDDFAHRVDIGELERRMPFKPSLMTLEGTVLHEERHAEQFNRGMFFGQRKVHPVKSMANIRISIVDAAIESHCYFYELEYLRNRGNQAGAAYAAMCSTLRINVLIPGWIRVFNNTAGKDPPELTGREKHFLKPYLEKVHELKDRVRTVLNSEGLLAKEFTL